MRDGDGMFELGRFGHGDCGSVEFEFDVRGRWYNEFVDGMLRCDDLSSGEWIVVGEIVAVANAPI
jgi:hypothetical protein